MSEWWCF